MSDNRTLKKITELLAELSSQPDRESFFNNLQTGIETLIPADCGTCIFEIIDGVPKCLRWPPYADYLIDAYNSYYCTIIPSPFTGISFEVMNPVEWSGYDHTEYVSDFHNPLRVARSFGTVFYDRFRGKRHFIGLNRSRFAPPFEERECETLFFLARHLSNLCSMRSELDAYKKEALYPRELSPECELLSRRETEIAGLLLRRKTMKEIAGILGISPRTVERHVLHIYHKLKVDSRKEMISRLIGAEGETIEGVSSSSVSASS